MASRRVRIKGVANIPQRRKPGTANCEEIQNEEIIKPDPEIKAEIVQEIPNLKIEPAINLKNETINEQPVPTSPNNTHTSASEVVVSDTVSDVKPKVTVISRRRFIKPAISANVINRRLKTKVAEEAEKQTENVEPYKVENDLHINLNETPIPSCNDWVAVKKIEPLTTQANNKVAGITRLPKPLYIDGAKSGSDTEYPAPPASPSKFVNRTRIKAIPRLGQRRASFSVGSASESEDENKRGPNRIRNDSVCSTTSGTHENQPFIDANVSPIKKEFSSVIQRKCRRTEQSRKLAEARRDFQQKFNKGKPDRQRLTMIDLIFYNPTSNPMSQKNKTRLDTEASEIIIDDPDADVQEIDNIENEMLPPPPPAKTDLEEENAVPAPQITIGANGEIIVDEQSLVIENKETIQSREALKKSQIVDGDFDTGYGVYKRGKRSKDWSKEETLRFYKALNTIGTDFTLMCELFPDRTRRELKMKFKKEERMNRALIDRAVMQPINFDMTELRLEVEKAVYEKLELESRFKEMVKIREANHGRKRNRKNSLAPYIHNYTDTVPAPIKKTTFKPKKQPSAQKNYINGGINSILGDDSDSDNSTSTLATIQSRASISDADSSDVSADENPAKIQKTRSGRISKPKQSIDLANKKKTIESNEEKLVPGSIMIVTNEESDPGDSKYTVYIVDENCKKVQIELTPEILENLSRENGDMNSVLDQLNKSKPADTELENNNSLLLNDTIDINLLNSTSGIIFENDSMIIPFDEFNCLSDEDVSVREIDTELAL